MKATLALCDAKGSWLYDARPDLFPYGRLSTVELQLWGMYYEDKERQMKQNQQQFQPKPKKVRRR